MTVLYGLNHRFGGFSRLCLSEDLFLQNLIEQFTSFHQLHDQAPVPLILEDVDELNHIWVVHLLQDIDLLLQPNFVFFRHLLLAEHFNSVSHSSSPIFGFLDRGETASTQSTLNLVGFLDVAIIGVAFHLFKILWN